MFIYTLTFFAESKSSLPGLQFHIYTPWSGQGNGQMQLQNDESYIYQQKQKYICFFLKSREISGLYQEAGRKDKKLGVSWQNRESWQF